jgi:arsenate-mycothiol transferase
VPENKPTILFVCVHNAGKSQMAAALMRAKAGDAVNILSGGTHPGDELNGPARTAVGEIGASMDGEFPKAITDEVFRKVDRIVILGNEAKLTPVEGMIGTIETWLTPEPGPEVGDKLAQTRIIRDDIVTRVEALIAELADHRL